MADKKISELPASSALDLDDFLAVVEDGTTVQATIEDILALSTSSGLPEGYSIPEFVQGSGSNQTTTMTAAIDALPDDSGTVLIPSGIFYSHLVIGEHAGLTIRGAGKLATTIIGPTSATMVSQFGTSRGSCTFEDMTFDLTATSSEAMVIYPEDRDTTFRRCRFINISNRAITTQGAINPTFEDCEFDDAATASGLAIAAGEATHGLRWIRSTARFMEGGIIFDSTPHDHIDVDGGLFDGGWYLLPTRGAGYTNSGGTVTYTSTVLTDSAASFGTVTGANVRALTPLESGSTGTSYYGDWVSDATALFVSAGVHPGYIIRTSGKWAVVASVDSETQLFVEEWFDSTTYRPTDSPAAATAYTVYKVVLGYIRTANTGTTITVDRWQDFHDGTVVTPAAGTLYEVLIDHGQYSGIHASADTPSGTGGIKGIRVHGGCHITRGWNDQLSIYGSDARLVVDSTVLIDHGQDYGVTCHGDHARIFCTAIHNGAVGILSTGEDCQINAFASGNPNIYPLDSYIGDIVISGSRTRCTGSVTVASGANALYGFVVAGPTPNGDDVDAVDLTGTSAHGYANAGYRLYPITDGVTNTKLWDATEAISSYTAGAGTVTGTVAPAEHHGLTTITSRWAVPGCWWASASVSTAFTLDTIYYEPFIVYSPITVTNIGIDVITPGTAGHTARLNIYSANTAWQPVTRLTADGTVAIDATGLKQRSSLALTLNPGLYLAAYNGQSTASHRTVVMTGVEVGSSTDVWSTHIDRMSVGSAYGAMPASGTAWTTGTAVTTIGVIHGMWMKWTT